MIHSDELGELLAALSAFQGAVEAVPKDSSNPFFKSKFASLPNVVKAAAPLLVANGLAVTQHLGHDEQGDTLTTLVGHKSGQYMGDTMQLRPVKNDPQAQGSATTYGRRYSYMAALGLVADEDDDGNEGSKPDLAAQVADLPGTTELATKTQLTKLAKAKEMLGETRFDAYLAAQGVDSPEELAKDAAESVLEWARNQAKQKAAA